MIGLIVLLAIAVIGLGIYFARLAYLAQQKRQQEFLDVAREHSLTFDPASRRGFDREHPQFECFAQGHSRRALNLLRGRIPGSEEPTLSCTLGDYEYKITTSNGKSTKTVTYRFGFVIIETPWNGMPDMLVRREGLFDKLAGFLGFDDIDFESAEFSRTFMVKCKEKRFAYDMIDAQMMEFLMVNEPAPPNIDIGGHAICLWYGPRKRLEPRALIALMQWGDRFVRRWPRVLRAQLNERNQPRED